MIIFVLLIYAVACAFIALFALDKTIGFWGAFFSCFFLTPAIGIWMIIFSKSKAQQFQEAYKIRMQQAQLKSLNELKSGINSPKMNIADELKKIEELKNSGAISHEEFDSLKGKLLKSL